MEGKVEHKFDMEPHGDTIGDYRKLCRERTNKAMIKTRQIQVSIYSNFSLSRHEGFNTTLFFYCQFYIEN